MGLRKYNNPEFAAQLDPDGIANGRLIVQQRPHVLLPGDRVSITVPDQYWPLNSTYRNGIVMQNRTLANYFIDRPSVIGSKANEEMTRLASMFFCVETVIPDDHILRPADLDTVNYPWDVPTRNRQNEGIVHIISRREGEATVFSIANVMEPTQRPDIPGWCDIVVGLAKLEDHLATNPNSIRKSNPTMAA